MNKINEQLQFSCSGQRRGVRHGQNLVHSRKNHVRIMKSRGESRIMTRIKNHRVESRITKWNQESPSRIKNHNLFQNHHRNLGLFCLYNYFSNFQYSCGFFWRARGSCKIRTRKARGAAPVVGLASGFAKTTSCCYTYCIKVRLQSVQ